MLNTQHSTVGGRAASYPAGITQLPGEGQARLAADRSQRPTSKGDGRMTNDEVPKGERPESIGDREGRQNH